MPYAESRLSENGMNLIIGDVLEEQGRELASELGE